MKTVIVLVAMLSCVSYADSVRINYPVEICFSPQGKCSEKIVKLVESAKSSVIVAVYWLTDKSIDWLSGRIYLPYYEIIENKAEAKRRIKKQKNEV